MIYDYRCLSCKESFQKDLPIRLRGSAKCPHCRSKKTRRVIHRPTIIFKGSGFYSTDKGK